MFRPHIGSCTYPDCGRTDALIVVTKGWCDRCNYKHKQAKKKAEGKNYAPYKYVRQATGELELFKEIVDEIPDDQDTRCSVCQLRIPLLTPSNMAHILPKAENKYPKMKLYKKNIKLMCHDIFTGKSCHSLWDTAPRSELKLDPKWDKIFELEQDLLIEYPNYNP